MASIGFLLAARNTAMAKRDFGQVKAINADLARLGYVEQFETTAISMPEHAIPPARRGRPPKVRE